MGFEVKEVWALTHIDNNGEEGIVGMLMGNQWMPFVCADKKRLDSMLPEAKSIAKATGKKIRLIKLSELTVVSEDINAEEPVGI
jgi:hypothetical protein